MGALSGSGLVNLSQTMTRNLFAIYIVTFCSPLGAEERGSFGGDWGWLSPQHFQCGGCTQGEVPKDRWA